MSRLHLLILWILTLVAGLIVFNTKNGQDDKVEVTTSLAPGADTLQEGTLDKTTSVIVSSEEDTTTIVAKDNRWFVSEEGDFPVNLQNLAKVFDALQQAKVVQAVAVEEEYYDRFHLDPEDEKIENRPKTITLKNGEETLTTFYVGKRNETKGGRGSGSGRYVRLGHDDSGVYVISDESRDFSNLETKPENWITKSLTLLDSPIKVEVKAKEGSSFESWVVSRDNAVDDFTLEDLRTGYETKTTETAALKSFFTQVNFADLLNEQEVTDQGYPKDQREVYITDSSGANYHFTIIPEKVEPPKRDKDDKSPPPIQEPANYIVSFKILNGPTEPVKPAEDASDQVKAEYQARVANRDKLIKNMELQKTLEGRNFKIAATHIKAINKRKEELEKMKKATVTTKPVQVPAPGPVKDNPNPFTTTPPVPGSQPGTPGTPGKDDKPKKRIEAVTPPIAIPPRPEKKEGSDKPKPEGSEKDTPEKDEDTTQEDKPAKEDTPKKEDNSGGE